MATNLDAPLPFEVRQIAYEFEDKPGVFKRKPVIIISQRQVGF